MANYEVLFYTRDAITVSGLPVGQLLPNREFPNYFAGIGNTTIVHGGPGPVRLKVSDAGDSRLGDRADADQLLAESITVNGVTYPAGRQLEIQYSYVLEDSNGNRITIHALDLYGPGANSVEGFVSSAPLNRAETYRVVSVYDPGPAGSDPDYADLTVCFTANTAITSPDDFVQSHEVRAGMQITTKDDGPQTVRWSGSRTLDAHMLEMYPKLRPIRIRAGALGSRLPERDLVVSPQHRMLVCSAIAVRMFDSAEVLVAAKQLLCLPGIDVAEDLNEVTYVHFLFDRHQIVFAEGAPTESLYPGKQALKSIGAEARNEILTLFPELADLETLLEPARPLIPGRRGRKLAERLCRNSKPALDLVR